MPRAGGASSTPRPADSITAAFGYWVRLRSLSYGGQVARCCFFRHCERSEAIHLSVQEVTMDCFASLAMTVDTVSPSRDALRPRFAEIPFPPTRGRREDRVRAAPAVSCAMCTKKCAHEHTGPAESIRPSLRNGLTAYGALFPETNSFCLRHRRIDGFARPGWACENLRRFDTSHGCQNHTLLPYANCAARPARIDRSQPQDKA